MKKNSLDKFETTNINKINSSEEDNFFMNKSSNIYSGNLYINNNLRRMNDYDSNILEEDAYKGVSDELFKLEYKISRIEDEMQRLDAQIMTSKEIDDENLTDELIERKKRIIYDYKNTLTLYGQKSLSAKISGNFSKLFNINLKEIQAKYSNIFSYYINLLFSRLPKNIISIIELRKSLIKLENLNKSVDDLISLNIPYGENSNKYEQLSKYIIKANSIQSDISKQIKVK